MTRSTQPWDVVIVGAGPAGLSAALILGRCCRKVLLCDRGTPRSWASHAIHGYLACDGIHPERFREQAHNELRRYPTVLLRQEAVLNATHTPGGGFSVHFETAEPAVTRKLLLATGLMDELPPIKGVEEFFGTSVFACPYCDGWERRGAPIAVYARGRKAFEFARAMTAWTSDIVLCTDGTPALSAAQRKALAANHIALEVEPVHALRGRNGQLECLIFASGRELPRAALFFDLPCHSQSDLARSLGCEFTSKGGIRCGRYEASSVPGVFVAGNILKDVQLSIVAAAEGARAAFGINRALTREDFARRAGAPPIIDHPGPQE